MSMAERSVLLNAPPDIVRDADNQSRHDVESADQFPRVGLLVLELPYIRVDLGATPLAKRNGEAPGVEARPPANDRDRDLQR